MRAEFQPKPGSTIADKIKAINTCSHSTKGIQYRIQVMNHRIRDVIESALSDSLHSRRLDLKEFPIKGTPYYDIDKDGVVVRRRFGIDNVWEAVVEESLSPLIEFLTGNDRLSGMGPDIAKAAREQKDKLCWSEVTVGKNNQTKEFPKGAIQRHRHRSLNASNKQHIRPDSDQKVASFESLGERYFVEYVVKEHLPEMNGNTVAGKIHLQDLGNCKEKSLSYTEAHMDDGDSPWVAFVPLTGRFWAFIAVSRDAGSRFYGEMKQRLDDSEDQFGAFCQELSRSARRTLDAYIGDLKEKARGLLY